MLIKKYIVFFSLILFSNASLHAETVLVSIFNEHSLSSFVLSPVKGKYRLVADSHEIFVLKENELLYVSITGERLLLIDREGSAGVYSKFSFVALEDDGEFSIRPVEPAMGRANYFGSLDIGIDYGRIAIINEVDKYLYLAGVVEAESGINADYMFYKAHSIICRTYLQGNLNRHIDEGFHVCDEVHCQVYKGRLTANELVYKAVKTTSGKVITYEGIGLITAAFHSNCGGQTVNSEDIWLLPRPYLRSVNDPYCLKRPGAVWEEIIDTQKWESYLAGLGLDNINNPSGQHEFTFLQPGRKVFYRINDFAIPFARIRSDWNFRSAWFNIKVSNPGHRILIKGRGYGHGAGLCQEGAMEMASRGYNFIDILQFYYTDIDVINIDESPISRILQE